MQQTGWLDAVKTASFVAEVTLFNGNVGAQFLHLSFIFETQANGLVKPRLSVVPFGLNLYAHAWETYFRLILEICVVLLFSFFLVDEYNNFSDAPVQYLKKPLSWLSVGNLALCFTCVILYIYWVTSHSFSSMELPLEGLQEGGMISKQWIEGVKELQFLSERAQAVATVGGVNICFIFLRLLTLMSAVSPNLGLVLQSLGQGSESFSCFTFIFLLLFCGFGLSGYLQFGGTVEQFSTWYGALLTCLRMTIGDFDFKEMHSEAQNPFVAVIWFVIFMAIFFLVLVNMFLSIIVSCYNKQVRYLNEQIEIHGEIDSLKIFAKQVLQFLSKTFNFLERLKMLAALNASSGSKKLNLKAQSYPGSTHCVAISTLFLLFFLTITRIARIRDSLTYQVSTGSDLQRSHWTTMLPDAFANPQYPAARRANFSSVTQMAELHDWIRYSLIDEMYSCVWDNAASVASSKVEDCFYARDELRRKPEVYRTREQNYTWLFAGNSLQGKPVVLSTANGTVSRRRLGEMDDGEGYVEDSLQQGDGTTKGEASLLDLMSSSAVPVEEEVRSRMQEKEYSRETIEPRGGTSTGLARGLDEEDRMALRGLRYLTRIDLQDKNQDIEANAQEPRADERLLTPTTAANSTTSSTSTTTTVAAEVLPFSSAKTVSLGYVFDHMRESAATNRGNAAATGGTQVSLTSFTPRVRDWSVGFMRDNFIRLTIQPACYRQNDAVRWRYGYPFVLETEDEPKRYVEDSSASGSSTTSGGSSTSAASTTSTSASTVNIKVTKPCFDFNGQQVQLKELTGEKSGAKYVFETETSFMKEGGYVIGLGKTKAEAQAALRILQLDGFFAEHRTRRMSFDWMLYNPNWDLFSYNTATFEVSPTAELEKKFSSTVFPVAHIYSGGSTEDLISDRALNTVLMILYVLLVVWVTLGVMVSELLVQHQISSELGRPFYGFIFDFFDEDSYNYVNALGALANIMVIVSWLQFVALDVHELILEATGAASKLKTDSMNSVISGDLVQHERFAEAASSWNVFVGWSAINSFLLALRIMKYFGEISAVANYKQDESPAEEVEYEFHEELEKAYVGPNSFKNTFNAPAETAGVRPGWVVDKINEKSLRELLHRARGEAEKKGEPFAGRVWFDNYIKGVEPPCQIVFKSQTGMTGTLVKALARCISQVLRFTMILMILLLGFAILFHIQFGTQFKAFANPATSIISLVRFMMGDVFALESLLEANYPFTYVLFWGFEVVFFFVLSKQFLAVMVYSWKVHREETQVYGIFRNLTMLAENAVQSNPVLLKIATNVLKSCSCGTSLYGGSGKGEGGEDLEAVGESYWRRFGVLKQLLHLHEDSLTVDTASMELHKYLVLHPLEEEEEEGNDQKQGASTPGNKDPGGEGGKASPAKKGENELQKAGKKSNSKTPAAAVKLINSRLAGPQQNPLDPAIQELAQELRRASRQKEDDFRNKLFERGDIAEFARKQVTEKIRVGVMDICLKHICLDTTDGLREHLVRHRLLMQMGIVRFDDFRADSEISKVQMPQFLGRKEVVHMEHDLESEYAITEHQENDLEVLATKLAMQREQKAEAEKEYAKSAAGKEAEKKSNKHSSTTMLGSAASASLRFAGRVIGPGFSRTFSSLGGGSASSSFGSGGAGSGSRLSLLRAGTADFARASLRKLPSGLHLRSPGRDAEHEAAVLELEQRKERDKLRALLPPSPSGDGLAILRELLLDTLLTSLEGARIVQQLRELFERKTPQFEPENSKERAVLTKKALLAGKRFELFRAFLEGKVRRKLVATLIECAEAKSQINKEQTVILYRYSQEIQNQSSGVEDQIQGLMANKNALERKLRPLISGEPGA
ncbi:unnamed protein product [Amoebophrya sp. A25]|nr:unnamed protein product [Amoebophrya sp. A25]|eukprot:GSA25T00020616001.1